MAIMHMAVGIQFYKRMVANHWEDYAEDFTNAETGEPATQQEALDYLNELQTQGLRVVPPCDNTKPDGTCAGHPDRATAKSSAAA